MNTNLNVQKLWWRNVQPGEFYNIERFHQIAGGGGSLYIEIPSSMVSATLDFLGCPAGSPPDIITIDARVIGAPSLSGPIHFQKKSGGRMRIARQNRQQPGSQRHPAWDSARGFPTAPDGVGCKQDALPYFPRGGLRIFIAKTFEEEYYAGFNKGPRPSSLTPNDPDWDLYGDGVGGVVNGLGF